MAAKGSNRFVLDSLEGIQIEDPETGKFERLHDNGPSTSHRADGTLIEGTEEVARSDEKPQRHDNVNFHFLGGDREDSELPGSVLVRDGEMVLAIPGGCGPYLIAGKARKHWFEGTNSALTKRYDVEAKWADVAGTYVGTWFEGDFDYLFSFQLG